LKALRYGDRVAWEAIYKRQCVQASVLHRADQVYIEEDSGSSAGFGFGGVGVKCNGFAWFQAWAERVVNLKEVKLGRSGGGTGGGAHNPWSSKNKNQLDIQKALQWARAGYAALDSKIAASGALLGTESLTSVDIILFGHLAEALCDVHLVTVLEEFKNLVSFFQNVYQKYFGKGYLAKLIAEDVKGGDRDKADKFGWIKANDRVNALNQFNHVPMNGSRKVSSSSSNGNEYQDAIRIMQTVALHCHDLQEVLADMALQKKQEDELLASESSGKNVGNVFQKWRMGAELKMKSSTGAGSSADDDSDNDDDDDDDDDADDIMKKNKQHMKNMMRVAKKNDELWLSGVVCATVIGLLAASNASTD